MTRERIAVRRLLQEVFVVVNLWCVEAERQDGI
jgi:hypothetical protein